MIRLLSVFVASGVSLMMTGCASWQAERQAAHDSAIERTEIIGDTVETLSGATRTVTTDSLIDDQGKPFSRETVTTTPGDRQLVSVGFSLEPGASIEFRNNGTASASMQIEVGEPVASMTNAFNDTLDHAETAKDSVMETAVPAATDAVQTVVVTSVGAVAGIEIAKNARPEVVSPEVVEVEVPSETETE
ncbi:MAG: hypothetical protein AAGJ81_01460 [Verrucomicrobiota bacterium]